MTSVLCVGYNDSVSTVNEVGCDDSGSTTDEVSFQRNWRWRKRWLQGFRDTIIGAPCDGVRPNR